MKNTYFSLFFLAFLGINKVQAQDFSFQPTTETVEGMKEVKRLVQLGSIMDAVLVVTAFTILFEPSQNPADQVLAVNTTDWGTLVKSFNVTDRIVRNSLHKHCQQMMWEHTKMSSRSPEKRKQIRGNLEFWKKFQASLPSP